MKKDTYKFYNEVNEFLIDTVSSDVLILEDEIDVPTAEYTGDFIISEGLCSRIKEECSKNKNNCFRTSNGSIVVSGNSKIVINGNVYTTGQCDSSSLRLIIPKNYCNLNITLKTVGGDVTIDSLTLSKLIHESVSGDLRLSNVDVLMANIKTVSGDVNTSICNSRCNYDVSISTVSGDKEIICSNNDNDQAINISQLKVKTVSGDIKILFKGRNN